MSPARPRIGSTATALAVALLFASSSLAQDGAAATASKAGIRLRDGVVVDLARGAVYAMRPGGGIDAIAIADGSLVWASGAASRPLALVGDVLLAQREGAEQTLDVELASLDVVTGVERARSTVRAETPMRTAIDDGLGTHFEIAAVTAGPASGPGAGLVTGLVAWRSAAQKIRGAHLADDAEAADDALQVVAGGAVVDVVNGGWSAASDGVDLPPTIRLAPADQRVAGQAGEQYLSADGRHVVVSERMADDRVWERWRWRLFDATTALQLGHVDQPVSIAPFVVAGRVLIVESLPAQHALDGGELVDEPLAVRGLELGSGRELWSREIRDTTYYGPFPP